MRFAAALLLFSITAVAQDAPPKSLTIALDPLGDRDHGVVALISFRFANPRAITDAGLFLEGTISQAGHAPRNFRYAVPRKDDKWVWSHTSARNGKIVRAQRWAVLPDQRNEMSTVHTFAEGEVEIEVWLVLEGDYGKPPRTIAQAMETFTLTKTNVPFADDESEVAAPVASEESLDAVKIRVPHRKAASSLFLVSVDVQPPVKRVEFWRENKKILARNAPPYSTELDLGDGTNPVALRAIGYDAAGRYVDADAFVVNDGNALTVKLTRVATSDGQSYFKLTVRNPAGTPLKSIALYAGDKKLHEWDRPPFAFSVPTSTLEGVEQLRASVISEDGSEANDVLPLR